jgi:hypothetical protein
MFAGKLEAPGGFFPWKRLPAELAKCGYVLQHYPENVLMPGERRATLAKSKGIHDLTLHECQIFADALKNNLLTVKTITGKDARAKLVASRRPVIVGEAPTPDSNNRRGRRWFANGRLDRRGLHRLKFTDTSSDTSPKPSPAPVSDAPHPRPGPALLAHVSPTPRPRPACPALPPPFSPEPSPASVSDVPHPRRRGLRCLVLTDTSSDTSPEPSPAPVSDAPGPGPGPASVRPRPGPASIRPRVSPTPRPRPAHPALLPPLPVVKPNIDELIPDISYLGQASQYSDGATHEEDEVEVDELFGTQGSKVVCAV